MSKLKPGQKPITQEKWVRIFKVLELCEEKNKKNISKQETIDITKTLEYLRHHNEPIITTFFVVENGKIILFYGEEVRVNRTEFGRSNPCQDCFHFLGNALEPNIAAEDIRKCPKTGDPEKIIGKYPFILDGVQKIAQRSADDYLWIKNCRCYKKETEEDRQPKNPQGAMSLMMEMHFPNIDGDLVQQAAREKSLAKKYKGANKGTYCQEIGQQRRLNKEIAIALEDSFEK